MPLKKVLQFKDLDCGRETTIFFFLSKDIRPLKKVLQIKDLDCGRETTNLVFQALKDISLTLMHSMSGKKLRIQTCCVK